jgi:hypothetical protein
MSDKGNSRFDKLFDQAFGGLKEYYPYLKERVKQAIKDAVKDKYVDCGDDQMDYEHLRDAIENLPEVQTASQSVLISNIKWFENSRDQDASNLPKTIELELDIGSDYEMQEAAADVMMEKFDIRPWSFDWTPITETVVQMETPRG